MSNTLELNQRIVYAGLVKMTSDRNLIKSAFDHWNKTNSDATVDVFDVLAYIDSYLDLEVSERKALMLGMHSATSELFEDLKPVPAFISGNSLGGDDVVATTIAARDNEVQAAHLKVTSSYLQSVSLNIKRRDPATHKELVSAVADEGLGGLSSEVSDWANDNLNVIRLSDEISVKQCQELAHEFYVLVCDFVGPVEADLVVNKSIDDVSNLQEAREFSPQRLL